MFEKVGEVVGLREFSTSVHGIRSAFGLQDFGSFSNSTLPGMVAKWPWHEFASRLSRTEIRFSLPLPRKALERVFGLWAQSSYPARSHRNNSSGHESRKIPEGEVAVDINTDGVVSAGCAPHHQLLESEGEAESANGPAILANSSRFDVNRDSIVSPIDALLVINVLNQQAAQNSQQVVAEGEGVIANAHDAILTSEDLDFIPTSKANRR